MSGEDGKKKKEGMFRSFPMVEVRLPKKDTENPYLESPQIFFSTCLSYILPITVPTPTPRTLLVDSPPGPRDHDRTQSLFFDAPTTQPRPIRRPLTSLERLCRSFDRSFCGPLIPRVYPRSVSPLLLHRVTVDEEVGPG